MPKAASKHPENPLIPHRRLRELYRAMAESRASYPGSAPHEATLIGTAMALAGCDAVRVLAGEHGAALSLALGTPAAKVRAGDRADRLLTPAGLLAAERISYGLGLAASGTPVLIPACGSELPPSGWRRLLTEAAAAEPPVLLLLLAEPTRPGTGLERIAMAAGVPAIPVDAADAIAFFRVASESLVRAQAGGGPALLLATALPDSPDPLALMRRQLLQKGASTPGQVQLLDERVAAAGRPRSARRTKRVH